MTQTPTVAAPDAATPLPGPAPITATTGNRAALLIIATQLISMAIISEFAPTTPGLTVTLAALVTLAVTATVLRTPLRALRAAGAFRRPDAGQVFLTFALAFLASRLLAAGVALLTGTPSVAALQFSTTGLDAALLILGGGLLIPLTEELAFRGFMLRGHRRHLTAPLACLSTGLAFGVAHGDPLNALSLSVFGYFLARVTLNTGSVLSAWAVHALNNVLALGSLVLLHTLMPQALTQAAGGLGISSPWTPHIGLALLTTGVAVTHYGIKLLTRPAGAPPVPGRALALTVPYILIIIYGLGTLLAQLPLR